MLSQFLPALIVKMQIFLETRLFTATHKFSAQKNALRYIFVMSTKVKLPSGICT